MKISPRFFKLQLFNRFGKIFGMYRSRLPPLLKCIKGVIEGFRLPEVDQYTFPLPPCEENLKKIDLSAEHAAPWIAEKWSEPTFCCCPDQFQPVSCQQSLCKVPPKSQYYSETRIRPLEVHIREGRPLYLHHKSTKTPPHRSCTPATASEGARCWRQRVNSEASESSAANLAPKRAATGLKLLVRHRTVRRVFAAEHENWTLEQWTPVLFSDECRTQT